MQLKKVGPITVMLRRDVGAFGAFIYRVLPVAR
jgi:hypothetical protein